MTIRRWATNVTENKTIEQHNGNAIHGELVVDLTDTPSFYVGGSNGQLIKLLTGGTGSSVSAVNLNADAIVVGNLTVNGTTTTLNSATLDVADKNITVAKGSANASSANGAGITVDGAGATMTYNSGSNVWAFNIPLSAPSFTGNVTGANVTGTVANATYAVTAGGVTSVAAANITGTVANANNALYLGGTAAANYLLKTGSASSLTSIPGANVTGTVANANYATYAGSLLNPGAVSFTGNISSPNGVFSTGVYTQIVSFYQTYEIAQTKANSTGTVQYVLNSGQTFIHTTPSANWTIAVQAATVSTTQINRFRTIIHQGNTAYVPNVVSVSGLPTTVKWQDNVTFAGNANKIDVIDWTLYGSFGSFTLLAETSTFG